jgi:hypothetical protein
MGIGIVGWFNGRSHRVFRRDHVLYFCHIPKTSGTTFDRMLRSRFPRGVAAPILDNHAYFTNPAYDLDQYDFISGHLFFGFHLPHLVSRPLRSVVLVREPRSLLLSMFKHGLHFDQGPIRHYIKANCPTPDRFFTDPVMAPHVANPMTRFLGSSERLLTPEFIARTRGAQPVDETAAVWATAPQPHVDDAELLRLALARLAEFDVVGMSEDLQGSVDLVARLEQWPAFDAVPHLNESPDGTKVKDLSPEVIRAIDKLTELDREIYRAGQELFTEAVRGTGPAASSARRRRTACHDATCGSPSHHGFARAA